MRVGIDVLQPQLHARGRRARRAEPHLRGGCAGQQRSGFGQAVADGIGYPGLEHELLGLRVEFGAADAQEAQPAAEDLHQLLAGDAVQVAAHESDADERAPKGVGVEFGLHLVAVDFLDDERHDEHHRGAHGLERRHERRGRGLTVEVDHACPFGEGVDQSDRAFVGVRERQHREEDIGFVDGEDAEIQFDLGADGLVGEHHPLGLDVVPEV